MATSKSSRSSSQPSLTTNGNISFNSNSSDDGESKSHINEPVFPKVTHPEAFTDWMTMTSNAEASGGATNFSWQPSGVLPPRDGSAAGAHGERNVAREGREGDQESNEEEEEDIDELFRREMDLMARERGAAGGCLPRPVSLPAALDQASGRALGRAGNGSSRSASRPAPIPSPLSTLHAWSLNAYRCARQSLSERLGRAPSSSNLALASRVRALREAREQCARLASIASSMASHLGAVTQAQRDLGRACMALAVEGEGGALSNEWLCNAEANNALQRNGATLVDALRLFVAGIDTLCSRTIDDTLHTVRKCEAARLEYDAYRSALGSQIVSGAAQRELDARRATFEKLRLNADVKLQLVDANRVIVLRRQLILFREALNAYFCGNRAALEAAMKPFCGILGKPVQTSSP